MQAKSGISDAESMGGIGNVCGTVDGVSARRGKVWAGEGMICNRLAELPKLDVAGSTVSPRIRFSD